MSDWKLPWNAACLCERVQMRVTAPPVMTTACHCRACQKLTSGPYSLSVMLPADGLEVEGETVIGGLHTPDLQHHICPHCKNWLFTRGERFGGFVNLRAAMLEDPYWIMPFVETNVLDRLPGVQSGAKHAYPEFPPPSEYGALMAAFARDAERP